MSRKKLVLSFLLLASLVTVGIILPAMYRNQISGQQDKKRNEPKAGKAADKQPVNNPASLTGLQYLGFEDLETFLPAAQTDILKTQLTSYLQEAGYADLTSVTFLVDETSYPSNGTIRFLFALSDGSKLPVTCLTADGTFTFGEENQTVPSSDPADTRIYTRRTDDTLPAVTTEEIEAMQEGGYADTESNDGDMVPNSTGNIGNTASNPSTNHIEEVTP